MQRVDDFEREPPHQRRVVLLGEEDGDERGAEQRDRMGRGAEGYEGGKAAFFPERFFHGPIILQDPSRFNG